MADFATQENFGDGELFNAQRINNAFATLAAQIAFITGRSQVTPATGDFLILYDISGNVLIKSTLAAVMVANQGTSSTTVAAGNDGRFPASITGIRKGAGAGGLDTAAALSDFVYAPQALTLATGAATANCALHRVFTVTLDANAVITLTNVTDGDCIWLRVLQDGTGSRTLAFTTAGLTQESPGGMPTPTAAANSVDWWKIVRAGTVLLFVQYPDCSA